MNDFFPILALETSQNRCGVCVYFSSKNFFQQSIELENSHAEKLFNIIDSVINSAGIEIGGIKCIAVSAGPGSFTGLRIGMSAAKSMAYALSLPVIPVPTFEAFALQVIEKIPEGSGFIIANKINSEEVFYAKLKKEEEGKFYSFAENLQIISKKMLEEKLNGSFLFGNALLNLPAKDKDVAENVRPEEIKMIISAPNAEFIAKWAEHFGSKFLMYNFEFLEPEYLKEFIIKHKERKI